MNKKVCSANLLFFSRIYFCTFPFNPSVSCLVRTPDMNCTAQFNMFREKGYFLNQYSLASRHFTNCAIISITINLQCASNT